MAEFAAAADPRLVALGVVSEIAVEFPEGSVDTELPEEAAVAGAPSDAAPAALHLAPTPPADPEPLPESDLLLRTSVVHGLRPRCAELSLERLGLRVSGERPVAMRWSDVTRLEVRRGRVRVHARSAAVALSPAIDGVAAPELNAAFARVLSDARAGCLDLQGTAVHELQNATDAVRDTFAESDDAFVPLALGGALVALSIVLALALPEILAFATRPAAPPNAFVLGGRLAAFDPRVVILALAAAAAATSLAARAALGAHATSWARGTLRGWHRERPTIVARLRRGLALVFLHPALAGAVAALALAAAVPGARSHASVDAAGVRALGGLPAFDRSAAWPDVEEVVAIAAAGPEHPQGLAVLVRFRDGTVLSTQDRPVRNASDRALLELARKWHVQAADARR